MLQKKTHTSMAASLLASAKEMLVRRCGCWCGVVVGVMLLLLLLLLLLPLLLLLLFRSES